MVVLDAKHENLNSAFSDTTQLVAGLPQELKDGALGFKAFVNSADIEGESTATPSRWKYVDDTTLADCTYGFIDSNL